MKKVKVTTIPTLKQMSSMADNLTEKTSKPSTVEITVWGKDSNYTLGKFFSIYVESTVSKECKSWAACQKAYFTFMEKGKL